MGAEQAWAFDRDKGASSDYDLGLSYDQGIRVELIGRLKMSLVPMCACISL